MRHGTSRRQRNRGNAGRRNNQPQKTQVYDSNGPDVRIRGTAYQVAEKYLALAKDANSAGDRIMAESYYQYAEHYIRIIGEFNGTFDASRINNRDLSDDAFEDFGNQQEQDVVAVKIVEKDDLALPASILKPAVAQHSAASRELESVD